MHSISLPISKSIANRRLILQALQGNINPDFPLHNASDDICLLHGILTKYLAAPARLPQTFDCHNCGTAMRFLTAFFASQEGADIVLTGTERMQHRPVGQLVEALRSIGAEIAYQGNEGFPPLHIVGHRLTGGELTLLQPQSTQFVSALMLISQATEQGITLHTDTVSPYIDMTGQVIADGDNNGYNLPLDWSATAFWYEYIALNGGEIFFPQLYKDTLQGDSCVADLFRHFGVQTLYEPNGVRISKDDNTACLSNTVSIDFSSCPDLYPAVFMTCSRLSISLHATGTESLPLKESDRLQAFRQLQDCKCHIFSSYNDHRIAMSLLAAGYPVDNTDCISKSYPCFMEQFTAMHLTDISILIPFRNISDIPFPTLPTHLPVLLVDDHSTDDSLRLVTKHYATQTNVQVLSSPYPQGKKHALRHGMEQACTGYVWCMDYDISLPPLTLCRQLTADLYILPLSMPAGKSMIERMQATEYAALQSLTLSTAESGHAVMCSGANLIVRKIQWLQSFPALHTGLPSGDDMFLLEDFKRRGLSISILYNQAVITPQPTLGKLLRQRMRWAGKAPAYKDNDIRLCGAMVVTLNLLSVLPPVWLIKYLIELRILKQARRYGLGADYPNLYPTTLLLSLLYPLYMLICLIGGAFRQKKW